MLHCAPATPKTSRSKDISTPSQLPKDRDPCDTDWLEGIEEEFPDIDFTHIDDTRLETDCERIAKEIEDLLQEVESHKPLQHTTPVLTDDPTESSLTFATAEPPAIEPSTKKSKPTSAAEDLEKTRRRIAGVGPEVSVLLHEMSPEMFEYYLKYIQNLRDKQEEFARRYNRIMPPLRPKIFRFSRGQKFDDKEIVNTRWLRWRRLRLKVRIWMKTFAPTVLKDPRRFRRSVNKRRQARLKDFRRRRQMPGVGNLSTHRSDGKGGWVQNDVCFRCLKARTLLGAVYCGDKLCVYPYEDELDSRDSPRVGHLDRIVIHYFLFKNKVGDK